MIPYIAPKYNGQTVDLLARVNRIFEELIKIAPNERSSGIRTTLLALFTSLALEHFRAIVILVESSVATGSAFALFRPLLESVTRGEWLYLCANDLEHEAFTRDALRFKSLPQLAAEVDTKSGLGSWLTKYTQSYTHLCDFTHGGLLAVGNRLTAEGSIEPNYKESRIMLLLDNSARMIVLHFAILAKVDGDAGLADRYAALLASLL